LPALRFIVGAEWYPPSPFEMPAFAKKLLRAPQREGSTFSKGINYRFHGMHLRSISCSAADVTSPMIPITTMPTNM
jgi:hypothetical protein